MILGLFDRSLPAETLLRHPELYKMQLLHKEFNMKAFLKWTFNSFAHSLFIFFLGYGILKHEVAFADGQVGDYVFMGNYVYIVDTLFTPLFASSFW